MLRYVKSDRLLESRRCAPRATPAPLSRQPAILPQGRARVVPVVDAAALELGDDEADEVLVGSRDMGGSTNIHVVKVPDIDGLNVQTSTSNARSPFRRKMVSAA